MALLWSVVAKIFLQMTNKRHVSQMAPPLSRSEALEFDLLTGRLSSFLKETLYLKLTWRFVFIVVVTKKLYGNSKQVSYSFT